MSKETANAGSPSPLRLAPVVPPPLELQERAVALTADAGNLLIDAGSAVGSGLVSAQDPVSSDPITAIQTLLTPQSRLARLAIGCEDG